MTKIIPAVLSHSQDDLEAKLASIQPYFTEAHIDLMDGQFVPNKTISAKDLRDLKTPLKLEAHLMVQDPTPWIQDLMASRVKRIIVHQEIGSGVVTALELIKSLGLQAGLSINPDSDLEAGREWWGQFDLIQVMSVTPGHYGGTFQPSALEKIRSIRERGFSGEIQVDGGVSLETAPILLRTGAKNLVVGSFLFGSEEAPELGNIGEKLESLRAALGTT